MHSRTEMLSFEVPQRLFLSHWVELGHVTILEPIIDEGDEIIFRPIISRGREVRVRLTCPESHGRVGLG